MLVTSTLEVPVSATVGGKVVDKFDISFPIEVDELLEHPVTLYLWRRNKRGPRTKQRVRGFRSEVEMGDDDVIRVGPKAKKKLDALAALGIL